MSRMSRFFSGRIALGSEADAEAGPEQEHSGFHPGSAQAGRLAVLEQRQRQRQRAHAVEVTAAFADRDEVLFLRGTGHGKTEEEPMVLAAGNTRGVEDDKCLLTATLVRRVRLPSRASSSSASASASRPAVLQSLHRAGPAQLTEFDDEAKREMEGDENDEGDGKREEATDAAGGAQLLLATDSTGGACVVRCGTEGAAEETRCQWIERDAASATTRWMGNGWAGGVWIVDENVTAAAAATTTSRAVAAHGLARRLDWIDAEAGRVTHSAYTQSCPGALVPVWCAEASAGPLLAVCEGSFVSIWDERTAATAGPAQRVAVANGRDTLYAVTRLPSGDIITGGRERMVHTLDVRSHHLLDSWRSACKHSIVGLRPAPAAAALAAATTGQDSAPLFFYAVGDDHEIMLCQPQDTTGPSSGQRGAKRPRTKEPAAAPAAAPALSSSAAPTRQGGGGGTQLHAPLPTTSRLHQTHHRGVRGVGRWLGVDVITRSAETGSVCEEDIAVGVCDDMRLYMLVGAHLMTAATSGATVPTDT